MWFEHLFLQIKSNFIDSLSNYLVALNEKHEFAFFKMPKIQPNSMRLRWIKQSKETTEAKAKKTQKKEEQEHTKWMNRPATKWNQRARWIWEKPIFLYINCSGVSSSAPSKSLRYCFSGVSSVYHLFMANARDLFLGCVLLFRSLLLFFKLYEYNGQQKIAIQNWFADTVYVWNTNSRWWISLEFRVSQQALDDNRTNNDLSIMQQQQQQQQQKNESTDTDTERNDAK